MPGPARRGPHGRGRPDHARRHVIVMENASSGRAPRTPCTSARTCSWARRRASPARRWATRCSSRRAPACSTVRGSASAPRCASARSCTCARSAARVGRADRMGRRRRSRADALARSSRGDLGAAEGSRLPGVRSVSTARRPIS
jgi:hypothetical protein